MPERTIDRRAMQLLATFEDLAGVEVLDLVEEPEDERLVVLIREDDVGKAVGKGGSRLQDIRDKMGMTIDVVAYDDEPEQLVLNYFRPHDTQGVEFQERADGTLVARVKVHPRDKGRAIGKGGRNVKLCGELVRRHTDIDQVVVDEGEVDPDED
jgi:N utilization substance protein A